MRVRATLRRWPLYTYERSLLSHVRNWQFATPEDEKVGFSSPPAVTPKFCVSQFVKSANFRAMARGITSLPPEKDRAPKRALVSSKPSQAAKEEAPLSAASLNSFHLSVRPCANSLLVMPLLEKIRPQPPAKAESKAPMTTASSTPAIALASLGRYANAPRVRLKQRARAAIR